MSAESARERRHGWARLAAEARLAWRQAQRTPGATALVAGLIAIGVAFVTWTIVEHRSRWDLEVAMDPGVLASAVLPNLLIAAFATILLAGSALMVSTRQQRRVHAVAASIGASSGCLVRIVLLQGALLGTLGSIVGTAAGIAAAWLRLALVPNWDGATAALDVPWGALPLVVLFGVGVSLAAATMPARAAARAVPVDALRDRPEEVAPPRDRPLVALVLAGTGVAATVGSLILFALPIDGSPGWWYLAGTLVGPILVIVGFLLGSRWVLARIADALGHLDTAARLAGRDAASSPRRAAPAIAVIAASAFVATALGTFAVAIVTPFADSYQWSAVPHSVIVTLDGSAGDQESRARELVAGTDPDRVVTVSAPALSRLGIEAEPDFPTYSVAVNAGECASCFEPYADVTVVSADDIDAILNTDVPDAARRVLRDGGVLIPAWPGQETGLTRARIVESTLADYGNEDAQPVRATEVPAVEVPVHSAYAAILTPETAAAVGMRTDPQYVVATYRNPLPSAAIDSLTRDGEAGALPVAVETGPQETAATAAAAVFPLTIAIALAAGVIALGLARYERRRDDAALAAVGASPALLRRVGAWEALIVSGTGSAVGTVAGAALMIGFMYAGGSASPFALPWPWAWIGSLAIGLPVVLTVAAWLMPPRRSDPTRRTAIA